MIKSYPLFLLFLITFSAVQAQQAEFSSNRIIVKLKPEHRQATNKSAIQKIFQQNGVSEVQRAFPNHRPNKNLKTGEVDLSSIYYLQLSEEKNIQKLIKQLEQNPEIEYAEPDYINRLTYDPSDTLNNSQWYLDAVFAYDAWDIETGDTNVVIAISDTGIDTAHNDLKANIAYNYNDPINGVDDDMDGYVDNYYGWNTASNNSNVQAIYSGHGPNVSGIASAVTDNVTGISGCGFNSRLMPVRIDRYNSTTGEIELSGAYESIVYAADHGAFIINCSWGSYGYSEFSQDIVNYAAINKGVLIAAGAGNGRPIGTGVEQLFYPAAYENVMSVGSLIYDDTVKQSSNYGYWLDIFAPGEDMLTTSSANGYGMNGGTSMAAPVVAGAAALVKSHFPQYTAKQVELQLKNTADNIDQVNDAKYHGKTGAGRINFHSALIDTTSAGLLLENKSTTGSSNNSHIVSGDTLLLFGNLINYLADANNVRLKVIDPDNKLTPIIDSISLGNINSGDTLNFSQNPIQFKIPSGLLLNEKVRLWIKIYADNFYGTDYLEVNVNNDFLTLEENNLRITYSSSGGIGFSGDNTNLGEGVKYLGGSSLLYEGSFAVGADTNYVADKFRGMSGVDNDFFSTQLIQKLQSSQADIELKANFKDKQSPNLYEIEQRNYLYKNKYLNSSIYIFDVKNVSNANIQNVFAGMIMDWDILDYAKNKIYYDSSRNMGVSYSTDSNLYCGIKALNKNAIIKHYAMDNTTNPPDGLHLFDGFSEAEKYRVLSTEKDSAGNTSPSGNDIIDVVSMGKTTLKKDSILRAAFALIVSNNINALESEADSVQQLFNQQLSSIDEVSPLRSNSYKLYPNPSGGKLNIEFQLAKAERLSLKIYDIQGRLVLEKAEKQYVRGKNTIQIQSLALESGSYFLQLIGKDLKVEKKFIISTP